MGTQKDALAFYSNEVQAAQILLTALVKLHPHKDQLLGEINDFDRSAVTSVSASLFGASERGLAESLQRFQALLERRPDRAPPDLAALKQEVATASQKDAVTFFCNEVQALQVLLLAIIELHPDKLALLRQLNDIDPAVTDSVHSLKFGGEAGERAKSLRRYQDQLEAKLATLAGRAA
jgi:hypothetical protein